VCEATCASRRIPRASRREHESESTKKTDYIPRRDANFQAWQSNFVIYANANLAALGLTAHDIAPMIDAQTGWATAFPARVASVDAEAI